MSSLESAMTQKFDDICREISSKEDSYSDDIEGSYERLLQLLSESRESRRHLSEKLVAIVKSYRHSRDLGAPSLSVDAIAYCMHELKWLEVLDAATIEHQEFFSKKMDQTLIRLIEAFSDDWSEANDYIRFTRSP